MTETLAPKVPNSLMGMGVILHDDPQPGHYVLRDWLERWFSLPWEPLLYWRWVPPQKRLWPKGQVIISFGHIHCYRGEWDTIRREVEKAHD